MKRYKVNCTEVTVGEGKTHQVISVYDWANYDGVDVVIGDGTNAQCMQLSHGVRDALLAALTAHSACEMKLEGGS